MSALLWFFPILTVLLRHDNLFAGAVENFLAYSIDMAGNL